MMECPDRFGLLFDFSEDVLIHICSQFLSMVDFCKLDTALCAKRPRRRLHNALTCYPALFSGCLDNDFIQAFDISGGSLYLQWLEKRRIRVNHLKVEVGDDSSSFEMLMTSEMLCPGIQTIAFEYETCSAVNDATLTTLTYMLRMANLRKLDMSNCDITDEGVKIIVQRFAHCLTDISLNGCVNLTEASLCAISQHCRCIQNLNLSCCEKLTLESFSSSSSNRSGK